MLSVVSPRFVDKLWSFPKCSFPRVLCAVSDRLSPHPKWKPSVCLHTARVVGRHSFSEQIHIAALPLLRFCSPTLLCGTFLRGTLSPSFDLAFITPWLPNVFLCRVPSSGVQIHTPATRPLHPITASSLGLRIYMGRLATSAIIRETYTLFNGSAWRPLFKGIINRALLVLLSLTCGNVLNGHSA